MDVNKVEFVVPENHKCPYLAAIGKMGQHPLYKDIFYVCGVFQSIHNLGLLEDCASVSDNLRPLWWEIFFLEKAMRFDRVKEIMGIFQWPKEFQERAMRLYESYIEPDFFDRLVTK